MSLEQADCWICQSLSRDTHLVYYETKTSLAKLNPDQLFRGYTFLTLKQHREQLHLLADRQRKQFLDDMLTVATDLAKALNPDRLNYELLGNAQAHLHWHLVPRYTNDPMWGRPIWAGTRHANDSPLKTTHSSRQASNRTFHPRNSPEERSPSLFRESCPLMPV